MVAGAAPVMAPSFVQAAGSVLDGAATSGAAASMPTIMSKSPSPNRSPCESGSRRPLPMAVAAPFR